MSARNIVIAAVWCAALVRTTAAQDPGIALVRNYLEARVQAMQASATEADVDKALAFCADDVVYEHPAVKAKIEGKENLKRGMTGYLGETKDASFKTGRMLANKNVVVAEVEMKFLAKQEDGSWKSGGRKNITVFELENGKIKRILDH